MSAASVSEEYRNLLTTQRALMARITSQSIESKDLAACARALDTILDRKRIMRNKPKPRDVDVTKLQRRARRTDAATPATLDFQEPTVLPEPIPDGQAKPNTDAPHPIGTDTSTRPCDATKTRGV